MATRALTDIINSLSSKFYDDISNQINRSTPLLQVLEVKPGTEKNVQWDARFGTAVPAGAHIADGADVTVFNSDDKVPAVLQYGTMHDAFALTGKALDAAAASGNPAQLANLFMDDMNDSLERIGAAVSDDMYNGTGATDHLVGLLNASGPLSATGTYAGINRATYTQWASNVVDYVAAAIDLDALRELRRVIYVASGKKPDLFVCDPATHAKIGSLYGQERRYVQDVRVRGQVITLDGGYMALEFDGIPIIEDKGCAALKVLALNTREVFMSQLPSAGGVGAGMGNAMMQATPEYQFNATQQKLSVKILPLAVTGNAFKFALFIHPALVCRKPNTCGQLTNFTL